MRILRPSDPVLAVLIADVHLSLKPPVARSEEPNWFAAMERAVAEVRCLADRHDAVVICAGDVFDKWNLPPELINWAIERLPHLHAIPGNHDLPYHRPDLVHRSAYGTLVRAKKITELGGWPIFHKNLAIYGRPFGEEIPDLHPTANKNVTHVLVTHQFLWIPGCGHVGAPDDAKLSRSAKVFEPFDVVVVGDNHIGFDRRLKRSGTHVVNCGTLLRRKANEADYHPRIGLLHTSGRVTFHNLDTTQDKILTVVTPEQERADDEQEISEFVESLANLEVDSLSFREAVTHAMEARKTSPEVKQVILEAME